MSRVLIVDDDAVFSDLLGRFLVHEGYAVRRTAAAREALAIGAEFRPEILITDWLLNDDVGGLRVALALQRKFADLCIVFMTGLPAVEIERHLGSLVVSRVYEKPVDLDVAVAEIRAAYPPKAPPDA